MNDEDDAAGGTIQDPPSPDAHTRRLRRRSRRIDSDHDSGPLPPPVPRDPNNPLDPGPREPEPKAIRDSAGTELRCARCGAIMAMGAAHIAGVLTTRPRGSDVAVCMECGAVESVMVTK